MSRDPVLELSHRRYEDVQQVFQYRRAIAELELAGCWHTARAGRAPGEADKNTSQGQGAVGAASRRNVGVVYPKVGHKNVVYVRCRTLDW